MESFQIDIYNSGLFIPALANKLHGDEPLMIFTTPIHDREYCAVSYQPLFHTHTHITLFFPLSLSLDEYDDVYHHGTEEFCFGYIRFLSLFRSL